MGNTFNTFIGALETMLKAVFNEIFVPAMSEIMSMLFTVIFTPIKMYFAYSAYAFLIMLCGLIDKLQNILYLFIGAIPISSTDDRSLMQTVFEMSAISNALIYITLAAVCICIVLTIVAVAKSMSSMTFENKKPVTYVLKNTGKACLSFIMVPLLCIFMLQMSNAVVKQAESAMTAHLGSDRVPTAGEYIFLTASLRAGKQYLISDVLRDMKGTLTKYKEKLVDENLDALGNIGSEIGDTLDTLSNGMDQGLVEDDFRIGDLTSALNKIDVKKASDEVLKVKKELEATIDAINKETRRLMETSSPYLPPKMDDELRMSYLNGKKDYLNTMHSGVDFSVFKIDYLLGFVAGGFIALMFMGLTIQFIRRMLELVVLYLTGPFFAAAIPLDEGEMFRKWRENFIAKFLAGFSVLFALRLYLLLIPFIFSGNIDMGTTIIGEVPNIGSAVIDSVNQGSENLKQDIEDQLGGSVIDQSSKEDVMAAADAMNEVIQNVTGYTQELGVGDHTLYESLLRTSGIKEKNEPEDAAAFVNSVLKLLFLIGGTWAVFKSQTMVMDIFHPDTSESTRQSTVLAFAAAKKIVSTGADVAKKGVKAGGTLALGAATGGVGGAAAAGLNGISIAKKGAAAAAKAAGTAAKTAAGSAKSAVNKGSDDS